MLYLICGLAIAIALIALWVAGDSVRRVDVQISAFLQKNVIPMREEIEGQRRDADNAKRAAKNAENRINDIQDRLSRAEQALESSRQQVAAMANHAKVMSESSERRA